jgi:hypothetical protein
MVRQRSRGRGRSGRFALSSKLSTKHVIPSRAVANLSVFDDFRLFFAALIAAFVVGLFRIGNALRFEFGVIELSFYPALVRSIEDPHQWYILPLLLQALHRRETQAAPENLAALTEFQSLGVGFKIHSHDFGNKYM